MAEATRGIKLPGTKTKVKDSAAAVIPEPKQVTEEPEQVTERIPPQQPRRRPRTTQEQIGLFKKAERRAGVPKGFTGMTKAEFEKRQEYKKEDVHPDLTGFTPMSEAEYLELHPPTFGQKAMGAGAELVNRALGTDFPEDKFATPRLITGIAGMIKGAKKGYEIGGKVGAMVQPWVPGPFKAYINQATGKAAGGFLGSGLGTVFGVIAPEPTAIALEKLRLLPEGYSKMHNLSPSQLLSIAKNEFLLDLVTNGGVSMFRLGSRALTNLATGAGDPVARELAQFAAREGMHLMPVQMGDRVIARMFVTVMGRFPLMGGFIRETGRSTMKELKEFIERFPTTFGKLVPMHIQGRTIVDDALNVVERFRLMFKDQYDEIYKRADDLVVRVIPQNTLIEAQAVLREIQQRMQVKGEGVPTAGPVLDKLKKFIEEDILTMRIAQDIPIGKVDPLVSPGAIPTPAVKAGPIDQTLKAMDSVMDQLDVFLSGLEKKQEKFAIQLLSDIRDGIHLDLTTMIKGDAAQQVGIDFRKLDEKFSVTMQEFFETTFALNFKSILKRGLRGTKVDTATRQSIDKFGEKVLKLESPAAIDELSRLASTDTLQSLMAGGLRGALHKAWVPIKGGHFEVHAAEFRKGLGLDDVMSNRYHAVKTLLEKTKSPWTMEGLEKVAKIFDRFEGFVIPDSAVFLARAGVIGGISAIIGGILPGSTILAGASGLFGGLIGMTMFFGGGKLFSRMISHPDSARAMADVMSGEFSLMVTRRKALGAIRIGFQEMVKLGEMSVDTAEFYLEKAVEMHDSYTREWIDLHEEGVGVGVRQAVRKVKEFISEEPIGALQ